MAQRQTGREGSRSNRYNLVLTGADFNRFGVVLCNQIRMLDFKQRNGKIIEAAPEFVVEDALARVRALLE